jgi:hypothetical protein
LRRFSKQVSNIDFISKQFSKLVNIKVLGFNKKRRGGFVIKPYKQNKNIFYSK